MLHNITFYALAVTLTVSALAVVTSKNLFHAVLWLALALTGTAGIFLLLDAEFLAAVQLLLYAGGIITIVVFAIVVTMRIGGGALISVVMLGFLVRVLLLRPLPIDRPDMGGDLTRMLGQAVATRYVLPFELLALLMLAGMLGAIYFARPEE
jgi:NADH-quinone oxidoreductase subunit J